MRVKTFNELKEMKINLCGLVLRKGEKERLYNICTKYNVPIKHPRLFNDDNHYVLWGITDSGIGLISTVIMNYLEENGGVIFNCLDELEEYLFKKIIYKY